MLTKLCPQKTTNGIELDARISNKLGLELNDEIMESVAWSQKFIETELPSTLRVTQTQFASLNNYTETMYHTTDRMFVTELNVMEVVIDRDINTIAAIDEVIQSSEDALNTNEEPTT